MEVDIVSGLFNYLQLSASNFLDSARGFADNTLGALFNLANLPKPKTELEPVPGFLKSSHDNFLEVLKRDFLRNGNTPAALYPFLKEFEAGNPKVAEHLNQLIYAKSKSKTQATPIQLFFCCLVASIELSNRPFYRVREAVDYIIDQYPIGFSQYIPELLALVDRYEKTLEEDPDLLFAKILKNSLNIIEEKDSEGYLKTLSINYLFPIGFITISSFESSSIEQLDRELETYFESHFPELKTLLSDAYQYFINKHLERLPAEYHLKFYKILLDYVTRISKNIQDNIRYEDKISDVYLDRRDRLFELKGFLETQISKLQEEQRKLDLEAKEKTKTEAATKSKVEHATGSPNSWTHQLTKVTKDFFQASQKLSSHIKSNPLQSLAGFLAVFGQRVSASSSIENFEQQGATEKIKDSSHSRSLGMLDVRGFSLNTADTFLADFNLLYNCNTLTVNNSIFACPFNGLFTQDYTGHGYYQQNPYFLSFKVLTNNSHVAYTGVVPSSARFGYTVNVQIQTYICPSTAQTFSDCIQNTVGLGAVYNIWVNDRDPHRITDNSTASYIGLALGLKPIVTSTTSVRQSPYTADAPPPDPDGDTVTLQTKLYANVPEIQKALPQFISFDSITGVASGTRPIGGEGTYWFEQVGVTQYNNVAIIGQDFTPTTHYSNLTSVFYVQFLSIPIQTNIPPNALYTVQSGQTLSIPSPTSVIFYAASGTPVTVTLFPTMNSSIPVGMAYDVVRQAVNFVANPLLAQRGSYYFVYQGCDSPGFVCAVTPGCIPPLPTCTNTTVVEIGYTNSNPTLAQLDPAQTMIGTPVTLDPENIQAADVDLDTLSFSSSVSGSQPVNISTDPITGATTFLALPGAATGRNYIVKLFVNDGHTGTTFQPWTISLPARPILINSLIPATLTTTNTGTPGLTSCPVPFINRDISADQLQDFINGITVTTPAHLPADAITVTYNSVTNLYDIAYNIPAGYAGTLDIEFSHPLASVSAVTSINAINQAPIATVSSRNLGTQQVFDHFAYDLVPENFFNKVDSGNWTMSVLLQPGQGTWNGTTWFGEVPAGSSAQTFTAYLQVTDLNSQSQPIPPYGLSATAAASFSIPNPGPQTHCNWDIVTDRVGASGSYDLRTCADHPDSGIAFTCSAELPKGFHLDSNTCVMTWNIQTSTAGSYQSPVTLTDTLGKTKLPLPAIHLNIPYSLPTISHSDRADLSVPINPASFTPELTGTFQKPSADDVAQTYALVSGPPIFTVASNGDWAANPQNGQQGNYTASIQVRNGDQVSTFSKIMTIPRAAIQTLSASSFNSYIARSFSMDACTLITDTDNPGSCSNFRVSFNPPEALAAYITNTGTVYNFNPLSGSGAQGAYSLNFIFTDKITGQVFLSPVSLTYLNQAPQAQNGVSQKTVTSTDESVFTTPYMDAADPDGDSLERIITGIPTGCLSVDSEKQLSCTNVPAGDHPVLFSFSDGHGGTISATLLLQISRVTQIPWYINRAQDALPGIAGSFFLFFLPIFLKYRRDRRKTAGLDTLYLKLPRVIADITKRQGAYLHHQALTHESHPLGVIPLRSASSNSQRRIPALSSVTAAATSSLLASAEPASPRASSPGGLRRRVIALMSAAPSGGAPNSPPSMPTQATPVTTITQDSPAATPVQPMSLALSYSKQTSDFSLSLEDRIRKITDHPESISEFQTELNLYLKALDQYHEHQGPDIVRNCNLMQLTKAIAQRLDDLIDRTKPQITDKITMMVHWLKLLYIRFVFYSSGLSTSPSIKLINKRNLLQGLTELIKAVRSKLNNPQSLALYKELEFLRALITSVPDEDRASLWKSLPFPCIRRPDRGTATLPDDALIPKAWFLQVLAIQELSQIARLDLSALTQLNTWVENTNGEGITGWIPFRQSYPNIQLAIGELLALRPLKNSKDRGEVNYWAADAYLSILEYWNLDSTRIQSSDLNYVRVLTAVISKMFSRTFADQVSEEFIKNIVFQKLQIGLLTLFKKLPAEMAASCLFNLSNEFKHPVIQALITQYLKETSTASLEEFYQELQRQYKNPEKAKWIDAWLRTAPDDTPGVIKLRGDIQTWRRIQSGRALAWLGIARSASSSADIASDMVTNPLRSPAAQAAIGAKAVVRPDPIGGSVPSSSEAVTKAWRSLGSKNSAASRRTLPGQTPGKVRDDKQEVGMEA